MLASDIIAKYRLYVDDQSSLSSQEELDLLNKIYRKVLDERPWSFLVQNRTSDAMSISVPYVSLPTDFKFLAPNYVDPETESSQTVVFVGTEYTPFQVISFANRNNYRNCDGVCYIDSRQRRLCFTKQPTSAKSLDYDYFYQPADLALSDTPVFDSQYHDVLYHGMCEEFDLIQQTEKGLAYTGENALKYNEILTRMALQDEAIKGN